MGSKGVHLTAACLVLVAAVPTLGQVFTSEFLSDPVSEGWELAQRYCSPQTWNQEGRYHQQLNHDACPPGPEGGRDAYRRSLQALNGKSQFFAEFRLETDGDRSGIPYGAPTVLVLANDAGVLYHITLSRDLVRFLRDVDLPIWFFEIEPDAPHTYRIELYANRYAFYIDAYLMDEGLPERPFLASDPRISWQGRSWDSPCENVWDYIRSGVIPVDGSGDYDSDGAATKDDFYFFHECLSNDCPGIHGGPDENSGPGCRFTDFDADADTDLLDFAEFQNAFGQTP